LRIKPFGKKTKPFGNNRFCIEFLKVYLHQLKNTKTMKKSKNEVEKDQTIYDVYLAGNSTPEDPRLYAHVQEGMQSKPLTRQTHAYKSPEDLCQQITEHLKNHMNDEFVGEGWIDKFRITLTVEYWPNEHYPTGASEE
jgi:hypothetical protein